MGLSADEVLQLLKIIDEAGLGELHLEVGDLKLTFRRGNITESAQGLEFEPTVGTNSVILKQSVPVKTVETTVSLPSQPEKEQIEPFVGVSESKIEEEGLVLIKAPMMGAFYRAPKPGMPPFVEVGAFVSKDSTLCLIEVMKTFNPVRAGVEGRIVKIFAENTKLVEFGQPLFLLEPVGNEVRR